MPAARTRAAAVALLAVLAIGAAAATLPSAVTVEGAEGAGGGGGDGGQLPARPGGFFGPDAADRGGGGATPALLPCLPFLTDPRFLAAAALVALVAAASAYRRGGPLLPIALFGGLAPFAVVVYTVFACTGPGSPAGGVPSLFRGNASAGLGPPGAGGGGGSAATTPLPAESTALLAVLALALVVAAALFVRATGDDGAEDVPAEGRVEPASTAAIGRAAGRAADRIERDVPADNAVYRAWREMTTHLDVADPATSTPAEFADAAVAAGMDPADVAELTTLFEAVRYGGRDPTADREARALDALRRIEAAYAEGSA